MWEVDGPDCLTGDSNNESHNVENSHGCSPVMQPPTEKSEFAKGKKEDHVCLVVLRLNIKRRMGANPGRGKTALFQNSAAFKTALFQNSAVAKTALFQNGAVSKQRCFETRDP